MKTRRRKYAGERGPTSADASKALSEAHAALGEISKLMQEALDLVERSDHRSHLYEIAGPIIERVPQELIRARDSITKAQGALLHQSKKAYTPQVEDLAGVQTLVRRNQDGISEGVSDQDRTKERALPRSSDPSPGQGVRAPLDTDDPSNVQKPSFNTPPGTGGEDEGISKTRTRNRPTPGEDYGHPYKDTTLLTRRTMEGLWQGAVHNATRERIWRDVVHHVARELCAK